MAFPLVWPARVLPSAESWTVENADRVGGVSLSGIEQAVSASSGRWRAKLTFSSVFGREKVALRGLVMGLRGRSGTVLVGPADYADGLPWGVDEYGRVLDPSQVGNPELAGTVFADAEGFAASLLARTIVVAAARRATTIIVRKTAGSHCEPGNYVGIGQRLHVISGVAPINTTDATCTIEPGLRAPVVVGTALKMIAPVCQMRLASPVGDFMTDANLASDVSLEFVEVP